MSLRLNARIAELQSSLWKQEKEQRSLKQQQQQQQQRSLKQQQQQIASAPVQLNPATTSDTDYGAIVACLQPTVAGVVETMSADSREGQSGELEHDEEEEDGRSSKRSRRSSSCTRSSGSSNACEAAATQKKTRVEVLPPAASTAHEPPQGANAPPTPPVLLNSISSSCCPVCRESPCGLMVRSKDLLSSFVSLISSPVSLFFTCLFVLPFLHAFQVRCGSCGQGYHSSCSRRGGGCRAADGSFVCKFCFK